MLPQAAKWAECSSGTPTLPYHAIVQQGSEELDADHQSARRAGKSPITQNGKGGANPGHDGKSYMTLVSMRPSPGEATLRVRGTLPRQPTPL